VCERPRVAKDALLADRYRLDAPEPDVGLFETWRAHDLTARAPVRIERLPLPAAGDFSAHLRALRALSDVGLAPVLDGGRAADGAFLVTGYDEGQRSLAHWLAGHRTAATLPSPATAQRLFDRIGAAVRFVHEARGPIVAHGALASRNVLVRRVGAQHAVRLLGLGALHVAPAAHCSAAWERATPYLASAQAIGAPASVAADLFALAVLHAEILTGRATATPTEPWGDAAERVRSLVRATRDDVPDAVLDALTRALSPTARERFPSAAAFVKAVRDAWTAANQWAPPGAQEPEPPPPDERSTRDAPAPRHDDPNHVPIGWQRPERAPVPVATSAPARSTRPPIEPPTAVDLPSPPPEDNTCPVSVPVDPLTEGDDRTEPVRLADGDSDDEDATHAQARPSAVVALATAMLGADSPFGAQNRAASNGDPFATDRVSAAEVAKVKASLREATDTEKVSVDEVEAARASLADDASLTDPVGVSSRIVVAPSIPALAPPPAVTPPAVTPPPAPPPPPPPPEPIAVGPVVAATLAALLLIALAIAWTLR
jgi:hypothetical protein